MHAGNGQPVSGAEISTSPPSDGGIGASCWRLDGFNRRRRRGYQQLWRGLDRADRHRASCQRNVPPSWQPDWDGSSGERNFSDRHEHLRNGDDRGRHNGNLDSDAGNHDSGHQHDYARDDRSKHCDPEHDGSKHVSLYHFTGDYSA